MPEGVILSGFLAGAALFSLLWGRALRYFDERSPAFRRWVLYCLGFTRRPIGEVRALVLTAIYYSLGLLASFLFALVFRLPASTIISFSATYWGLVILGAIGEISLCDLLVTLACRATRQSTPEKFAEMNDVPWIKGLRQLPSDVVPLAAALGGTIEELFFRGVVLRVLTDRFFVAPIIAVVIAGVLFTFEQLIQLRTSFQAMVIGCSCVAISSLGGLLVVLTGSVVPACFCHASFVLFFMTRSDAPPEELPARKVGAATR